MRKIFVTGTDTSVGKTYISVGILRIFNNFGYKTIGIKPIASGCYKIAGKLYNEDALLLQNNSSLEISYDEVNPFALEPSIAPHIAAEQNKILINAEDLVNKIIPVFKYPADICIIEGVGGWFCPLNYNETMAKFVKLIKPEIILVIRIKLGCLNHAILTYRAIIHSNIKIIGFVANCIDIKMTEVDQNIETLKRFLKLKCLGIVHYEQDPLDALDHNLLLKPLN